MTPQQHADDLLAEHQSNRGRKMTLFDWDQAVKPHLTFIEAGSSMAARHAAMLPCRAVFETLAQHELAQARGVLEASLKNIIAAQAIYASKPVENDRAA